MLLMSGAFEVLTFPSLFGVVRVILCVCVGVPPVICLFYFGKKLIEHYVITRPF